jgi:peroxiredoxin Q/BCP
MVSLDAPERNREFAESIGAKFPLLTADKATAKAYGVLAESGAYTLRQTFFIDPEGVIRSIDRQVKASSHGADLIRTLKGLGVGGE